MRFLSYEKQAKQSFRIKINKKISFNSNELKLIRTKQLIDRDYGLEN